MRMIDADLLKENCKITGEFMNNFQCVDLVTLGSVIDAQPTAYDLNKVVEQLEKESQTSASAKSEAIIGMCGASANHYGGEECAYERAIEIVKGGGVDG